MELRGDRCTLRPWCHGDEAALVRHANDPDVWSQLSDEFPHPYTDAAARAWVALQEGQTGPPTAFAIVVDREPVGGIGFERHPERMRRLGAAVGYWLGAAFWGRGIATDALRCLTRYAFDAFDFERLEAVVFDGNARSCRVLEKAGYAFEGRLRRGLVKQGQVRDALLFARLRDAEPATARA